MSNLKTINQAIKSRSVITFYYKGGARKVEPFLTGVHRDTGNDTLRAWFISGVSKSGQYNTWKMYTIDQMSNIQITTESFSGTRPGYNPDDDHMSTVYSHV